MLSDSDRIRLAIALVAVKFKPPDISFASYVLDLRSRFAPSTPSPTANDSWRNHALLMERNCAELQAKYEAEKIKLLAAEQLASSTSKKKTKKIPPSADGPALASESRPKSAPSSLAELKSMLKRLHDQINIPAVPNVFATDSILSSLNSVLQLTSLPDPQPALLLSATVRMIEAISTALKAVVLRITPNVPSEIDTLKTLVILLYHVLDIVIPWLVPSPDNLPQPSPFATTIPNTAVEGLIDTLLERTSTLILNPLIHSFIPLSQTYLDAILVPSAAGSATNATTATSAGGTKPPGHKSGKPAVTPDLPVDVRGDALSLFSVVFRALNTQLQRRIPHSPNLRLSLHTLRASVILEAVREFERISYSVPVSSFSSVPGNTNDPVGVGPTSRDVDMGKSAMRVKRLAMKDARWYMCTIMHTALSDASETPSTAYAPLTVSITPGNPEVGGEEEDNEVEGRRGARSEEGHILDKAISDALYRLVTRCKKTAPRPCHDETRARELNAIRDDEVLGQLERNMEKEGQECHVQPQGRVGDRRPPLDTPINGDASGKPEAQSAISDSGLEVGPIIDVGVNAGGRLAMQSGRAQGAESVPLEHTASNCPEVPRDDEVIDLDEIEHGMLLGVIERYSVWSESHRH